MWAVWSDSAMPLETAVLKINGTAITTNTSMDSNINFTYAPTAAQINQTLNFTITANDTLGNENTTSILQVTVTDNVAPQITLNEPANPYNTTASSITFNWSATENLDTLLTCNLTINSLVNLTLYF